MNISNNIGNFQKEQIGKSVEDLQEILSQLEAKVNI